MLGRDPLTGELGEGRDGRSLVTPVQLLPGRDGCYKMGACRFTAPASQRDEAAALPSDSSDEQSLSSPPEDGSSPPHAPQSCLYCDGICISWQGAVT